MASTKFNKVSRLQWVNVSDIAVDPAVQRALRPGWVDKHVPDFDPERLGFLVVSMRSVDSNGETKPYVVDGQHRKALMEAVGWGDQQIQCETYEGLTKAEEARLFLARNDRIAVRTYDKFRVRVEAEDPVAEDIARIVRAHDLAIDEQAADGHVTAVSALERVYRGMGIGAETNPRVLARTLEILASAWGRQASTFRGKLIEGIGLVCLRYGTQMDDETLALKLASFSGGAPGVIGRANALKDIRGGSLSQCVASVAVDTYNKGRRVGKLADWWS